jgi:hypothetical protein
MENTNTLLLEIRAIIKNALESLDQDPYNDVPLDPTYARWELEDALAIIDKNMKKSV